MTRKGADGRSVRGTMEEPMRKVIVGAMVSMIGHYERDGAIKIGDAALDFPSEREIARQQRMKREG